MPDSLPVIIVGAAGRMGREAVKAVLAAPGLRLQGAITRQAGRGQDAGLLVGWEEAVGISVQTDLGQVLDEAPPQSVVVDLTHAESALVHARLALERGLPVVIGATGLQETEIAALRLQAETAQTGVLLAPNFSIGALLMMKFAREAARWFEWAEIIELHHEHKRDAPSGTALRTAELMAEQRSAFQAAGPELPSRGQRVHGIPIHSVRLPGLLAHQQVLFGDVGQTLTLRHDSLDRASFMPGLVLAIERVKALKTLVYGLEQLLD
ncbi:MAG: 4-hydroxy-tetrahydrodipicolinate reductase [Candidatus Sericytochromatia bacterium]